MDSDSTPRTKLWPADNNGPDVKSSANDDFDQRVADMLDDALQLISDTEDKSPSSLPSADEASTRNAGTLTVPGRTKRSIRRFNGPQLEGEASILTYAAGRDRRFPSSRSFTGEVSTQPDPATLRTCQGCYQSMEVLSRVTCGERIQFLPVERMPSQRPHHHFDLSTTNIQFLPVQALDPDDPAACQGCAWDKEICLQPEGLIILTAQERRKQSAARIKKRRYHRDSGEVDDDMREVTNMCFGFLVRSRTCNKQNSDVTTISHGTKTSGK